jgi:hypothetical protein
MATTSVPPPLPRDRGPRPPFRPQRRLQGLTALITGGDSGIGRAVALAYAREGANVAISYLDDHGDARETQRLVQEAGKRALLLPGDISDDEHCAEIVRSTIEELGRVDVLVNNPAYQGKSVERFEDLDPERIRRTLLTNLGSIFFVTRHALSHLRPGAAIINTASLNAHRPRASILDYASTKGAIVTFTKGLSQELAERGIRVNAVAPGPVWTPPIVAPTYVFLASDESRSITGEVIGVTGAP